MCSILMVMSSHTNLTAVAFIGTWRSFSRAVRHPIANPALWYASRAWRAGKFVIGAFWNSITLLCDCKGTVYDNRYIGLEYNNTWHIGIYATYCTTRRRLAFSLSISAKTKWIPRVAALSPVKNGRECERLHDIVMGWLKSWSEIWGPKNIYQVSIRNQS